MMPRRGVAAFSAILHSERAKHQLVASEAGFFIKWMELGGAPPRLVAGRWSAPLRTGLSMNNVAKRNALPTGMATGPREEDDGNVAGPTLNENIQEQIGAKLKALFDESVNQAVPDRFVELLQALAEKEEDGADTNGGELP